MPKRRFSDLSVNANPNKVLSKKELDKVVEQLQMSTDSDSLELTDFSSDTSEYEPEEGSCSTGSDSKSGDDSLDTPDLSNDENEGCYVDHRYCRKLKLVLISLFL